MHTFSSRLYSQYKLRRVYYSAFSPIPHADARLPGKSPPLVREHRLYQADWLLRFYGYQVNEIVSDQKPDLEIDIDPKTSWALRNRHFFPVNVNTASREQLLRIPGIGLKSVEKILIIRRFQKIRFTDLIKLHVAINRAKHFIITVDYHPYIKNIDSHQLKDHLQNNYYQLALTF